MALKTKKAQPTAAQTVSLPKNIWLALRAAKEKTAQRGAANSDFSPFMVAFYAKARTYFERKG